TSPLIVLDKPTRGKSLRAPERRDSSPPRAPIPRVATSQEPSDTATEDLPTHGPYPAGADMTPRPPQLSCVRDDTTGPYPGPPTAAAAPSSTTTPAAVPLVSQSGTRSGRRCTCRSMNTKGMANAAHHR